MYDNDDDGQISEKNIRECAEQLDMEDELNESNARMMIEMADKSNKGGVNLEDFMTLMTNIGLLNKDQNKPPENGSEVSDLDREIQSARASRKERRDKSKKR